MESEANALEVDPMRNSVSGVTMRSPATFDLPKPLTHSGPSRRTMAIDTPGVLVSWRIFSNCDQSSSTDRAGGGCFVSAARLKGASSDKARAATSHLMGILLG